MLRFTCEHCGRELQSHPDNAQRSMNCPGCMKPVTIPADAAGSKTATAAPSAVTTGKSLHVTGAKQTSAAPAASGGKSIVLVVLGVLLLVAAGAGGVWYFTKQKKESDRKLAEQRESDGPEVSDMALLPANTQLVATVRSAELYKLPAAKDALEQARKRDPKQLDPVARMERDVGLKPDEIDRLHAIGADADKQTGWAVAKTLKPLDRERVLAKLEGRSEKRLEGRRYYLGKNADGQEVAVHFAGPTVLVVSDEEGMKLAMAQAAKPVVDGPLKPTIALVETSKSQAIVGLYPAGGGMEVLKNNALLKLVVDVTAVKAARFTLDANEKDATLNGALELPDEKTAAAVKKKLSETLPLAGFWLRLNTKPEDKTAGEAAAKLIGSIKPSVKGNELQLTAKTDSATMANGMIYLMQQALAKKEE
jgi:hypothetical protein